MCAHAWTIKLSLIPICLLAVFNWRALFLLTGPRGAGVWRRQGDAPGASVLHFQAAERTQQKEMQSAAVPFKTSWIKLAGEARKPPEASPSK